MALSISQAGKCGFDSHDGNVLSRLFERVAAQSHSAKPLCVGAAYFGFSDSKKEFGLAFFREPVKRERDQVNHTVNDNQHHPEYVLTLTLSLTLYQHVASTVLA
jgi:hypothetical protein